MRISCHLGPLAKARAQHWAARLCAWSTLVLGLAAILSSPLPTWAHNDLLSTPLSADAAQHIDQTPQPSLPAEQPTSPALPWVSLIAVLFMLTMVVRAQSVWRWRRTTALGLVLILGFFTFGIAVHSVHHLLEPEKAAECLVFSASQHVSGTLDDPCHVWVPGLAVTAASLKHPNEPSMTFRCRTDLPRAPPPVHS
jgi:hypothetical protein